MEALQADASRLLAEYDSSNSAGNRLQRRLLSCKHAFQLLSDRFSRDSDHTCNMLAFVLKVQVGVHHVRHEEKQIYLGHYSLKKNFESCSALDNFVVILSCK